MAGPLEDLIAPPYDVIDDAMRAELAARSPHNVVAIDLPPSYEAAAATMADWRARGVLVQEDEQAVWVLRQDYAAPDGGERTRTGLLARVRVDEYGPGRIRPHERTHPGPKEDRLRLTRATRANLSPIFALFPDRDAVAERAMDEIVAGEPFAAAGGDRLWRSADPDLVAELQMALADAELLIADGHHRYETARVYADEVGGEGEHRYVLMLLCSLSDPGLLVFPTHRLLNGLAGRPRQAGGDPRDAHARLRGGGAAGRARARAARGRRRGGVRLHGRLPQAPLPGDAQETRRSPTARSTACPRPTAGSTPRCSRRWCCATRSA